MADHGHALAKEHGGEEVLNLEATQRQNLGIFGWTFLTAVPRAAVGFTVGVTFTVSFIVLVVVGHLVIQGEAIVGGDEVD